MTEEKPKRRNTKGLEFYFGSQWRELKAATLKRDNYRCQYCGSRATSADHSRTRRLGGPDTLENLKAICKDCNEFFEGNFYYDYEAKLRHWLDSHDLDGKPIVHESNWDYNTDPTDT